MMRAPEFSKWTAGIVVSATILSSPNNGRAQTDLTPYRDKFVSACRDRVKVKSLEDQMSLPVLEEFCQCQAQRLIDLAKTREVPKRDSPAYLPFAKEVAQPCVEAALKAIGR